MSKASDYLEAQLINAIFRATPFVSPTTIYMALYTSDPTEADVGAEVLAAGTGYARQAVTFSAPADGVTSNNAQVSFPVATLGWGTITHVGFRDALTGGNLLVYGPLTPPHTVDAATRVEFPVGALQVQVL